MQFGTIFFLRIRSYGNILNDLTIITQLCFWPVNYRRSSFVTVLLQRYWATNAPSDLLFFYKTKDNFECHGYVPTDPITACKLETWAAQTHFPNSLQFSKRCPQTGFLNERERIHFGAIKRTLPANFFAINKVEQERSETRKTQRSIVASVDSLVKWQHAALPSKSCARQKCNMWPSADIRRYAGLLMNLG